MLKLLLTIGSWFWVVHLNAQNKLSQYLETGLNNNLVLKQKNISLQKSILALEEAKAMFLPSANFTTDYLTANGGRTILFPAGDLMNPVYNTLNQLTSSRVFSKISNVEAQLLPTNFYDSRIHLTYPLLNKDLSYNKALKKQEMVLQQYEIETYRHFLCKEIKQAYFNYCTAKETVTIYRVAYDLVQQNLRVNQSLINNGRGLPANVLRAESEVETINSKIIEAHNAQFNAKCYFNFLLNRPLGDSIEADVLHIPDSIAGIASDFPSVVKRAELKKIKAGIRLADLQLKMHRSYAVPKVGSFLDLGSQSSDFKFDRQSLYYFFGVQLDMPIFHGGRNRIRIHEASLDKQSLQVEESHLQSQLLLAAQSAQNNLRSTLASYQSSQKQLLSARAYFNLVDRGYKEGVNPLIEFIDARNGLTTAEIQVNVSKYKTLSQLAEYEYQVANFKSE